MLLTWLSAASGGHKTHCQCPAIGNASAIVGKRVQCLTPGHWQHVCDCRPVGAGFDMQNWTELSPAHTQAPPQACRQGQHQWTMHQPWLTTSSRKVCPCMVYTRRLRPGMPWEEASFRRSATEHLRSPSRPRPETSLQQGLNPLGFLSREAACEGRGGLSQQT